ncbi:phage tail protein [Paenibacillus sp. MER TA 81-3]|uniref:phage tail protein n=1 Tax=Paenibacillus sp. MER TA 81-3 TaxID=2939573 RepID=UPI00203F80DC|nr:phage tail protein [Paenibacillus sp. MER TA 81-3]MCM3341721.1 phage tail protein [Paenibacillus sp. MER TA 81-3]
MLGDIDFLKKPIKPQLFLVKPNGETISKLSEAYDINQSILLSSVNELSFKLPYRIDINHRLANNKNIALLKERYHVQVVLGEHTERYMIDSTNENGDGETAYKEIHGYALPYELRDKLIRDYAVESVHAEQVLRDVLFNTVWTIDYLDADFKLTYRAFDFGNTTVLDAVYQVAETYNAVVQWDTNRRTVSMMKPEWFGVNKGLRFSYGKYLKSLGKESRADEMVTRLKAFGQDGLSIHKVNPTGQNYIENFSYFMYPFERDASNTVIRSSDYMSDSLCHALLDYEERIEAREEEFAKQLAARKRLEESLTQKEVELHKLKNNEAVITNTMLAQQFDGKMFFETYIHDSTSSRSFPVKDIYPYAVLCKVSSAAGVQVTLNGAAKPVQSGAWVLLGKVQRAENVAVEVRGGSNVDVFLQVANISLEEFEAGNNEQELIDKFSLDHKHMQMKAVEIELANLTHELEQVQQAIAELQQDFSPARNFTDDQLLELNYYVIEKEFADDKYVEEEDLYQAAESKFKELQLPQTQFSIDIIHFLDIVEEQRNWDKLGIGDYVRIAYELLNIKIEARISEIRYDYENSSIQLTISNAKDLTNDRKKLEKFIYDSKNTSVTVDSNKHKWGKAVVDTSEMSKLFEHFWNKVTNNINMASNEYVTIDRKGITIIDPHDSQRFLRATHGALGLTRSGGLRYETAITPDGLIAEQVLGKIILGQRVVVGDPDGLFTIEGPKLTVSDRCEREVMRLGLYDTKPDKFGMVVNRYRSSECADNTIVNRTTVNSEDGFVIERSRNGTFDKTFYTSSDGDLYMKGNFQAGEGDRVFTINKDGLALGNSRWADAPFHADYFGNVWMNKLFADDAEIKNSLFKDGHIEGSSLKIGQGNEVFKVFPDEGIWAGHDQFDKAPFSVDLDGNLKARKATLTGDAGQVLIDTDKGFLDLDAFQLIAGQISAKNIDADYLNANYGVINDLTVTRLVTKDTANPYGVTVDYIDISEKSAKWITGLRKGSEVQAKTADGKLLYYEQGTSKRLTTEASIDGISNLPAMVPEYNKLTKMELSFENTGIDSYPRIRMGVGDNAIPEKSGIGFIEKKNTTLDFIYFTNNSGREVRISLADSGITNYVQGSTFKVESDGLQVKHHNGTQFEINKEGTNIRMVNQNGSKVELQSNGDIVLNATGKIIMTGSEIRLN